jgi:hypothetical protein
MPKEKVFTKLSIHLKLLSSHQGLQCPFCFYDQNNYRKLKQWKTQRGLTVHIRANHMISDQEIIANTLNVQEWIKSKSESYLQFLEEKGLLK